MANKNQDGFDLSGFSTVHLDCAHSVLQERRLVLEMTQKQAAEKAQIPLSTYQKFETGERNIRTASFSVTCQVLEALDLDIAGFFHGIYAIGEEVIIDKDGQKFVKTGRLTSEDIDDAEAINVMRMHIVNRSLIIPLKLLRVLDNPDKVQLMYHEHDKRFGIRVLREALEGTVYIPQEVYSGKWRGIRLDNDKLADIIYSIMQRETGLYFVEPIFNECGFIACMDEVVKSDYKMNEKHYYSLELE